MMKLHNYKKKITELEQQNKLLKHDLKLEKFPEGAVVYIIEDYDTDNNVIYKIGKTDDMNKRIKIHNTHSIHNKQVVYYEEIKCQFKIIIKDYYFELMNLYKIIDFYISLSVTIRKLC